jgi:hypothetical protein
LRKLFLVLTQLLPKLSPTDEDTGDIPATNAEKNSRNTTITTAGRDLERAQETRVKDSSV